MIVFAAKPVIKLARIRMSCVSLMVVNIRAPDPSQFRADVMRESWPVDLFWKVVSI